MFTLQRTDGDVVIQRNTPAYLIPYECSESHTSVLLGTKVTEAFWFHEWIGHQEGQREITISGTGRKMYAYADGRKVRYAGEHVAVGGSMGRKTRGEVTARKVAYSEFEEETGISKRSINSTSEFYIVGRNASDRIIFCYVFVRVEPGQLDDMKAFHDTTIVPQNNTFRETIAKSARTVITSEETPGTLDDEVSSLVVVSKEDFAEVQSTADWLKAALLEI